MTRLRLIFNLGKFKREVNVICSLWETVMKLFFQKLFNWQNNGRINCFDLDGGKACRIPCFEENWKSLNLLFQFLYIVYVIWITNDHFTTFTNKRFIIFFSSLFNRSVSSASNTSIYIHYPCAWLSMRANWSWRIDFLIKCWPKLSRGSYEWITIHLRLPIK